MKKEGDKKCNEKREKEKQLSEGIFFQTRSDDDDEKNNSFYKSLFIFLILCESRQMIELIPRKVFWRVEKVVESLL